MKRCVTLATLLIGLTLFSAADTPPAPERLRPSGIDGHLLLCGKDVPDAVIHQLVDMVGHKKGRLVVLSAPGEEDVVPTVEEQRKTWLARKLDSVVIRQASSRKEAEEEAFAEPLKKATGVWIDNSSADRLVEVFKGTAVEKELAALLQRGGVIGAQEGGAGALAQGLALLPGTVVEADLTPDKVKPGQLGIGLDDKSALLVQGRVMRSLGQGNVNVILAAGAGRPARTLQMKPKGTSDWTQFRRAARARTETPFPPKDVPAPEVDNGALVIVGGGKMPADVTHKFIELAGGRDALIVVLPTSNPDPVPANAEAEFLIRAGAKHVVDLKARELKDVEDPKNLEVLRKARAVWFGGGRQWRFVDAYEGTKAEELFRDVLRRGGVIGGSSAGATIQGDYLCRGSPLGNHQMSCEGYERGFGFLPGVAIDQHFTQRKRFEDMTTLMKTYPQLLGIGLDEATAIVVKGSMARVMGRGQVHFYDRNRPVAEGQPDHVSLKAGAKYDLKARKIVPPEKRAE
jgi:cyanophycinase